MEYKARIDVNVISSNEVIFSEYDGGKIAKTEYILKYSGSLEGKGEFIEIKNYLNDGTVYIIGMERITGTLGEKAGSFVLEHHGSIIEGVIKSHRYVLKGSGTNELAGIVGEVKFESNQSKSFFIFNYSLY